MCACVRVCVPTHAGVHGGQRSMLDCVFLVASVPYFERRSLAEPEQNTFFSPNVCIYLFIY